MFKYFVTLPMIMLFLPVLALAGPACPCFLYDIDHQLDGSDLLPPQNDEFDGGLRVDGCPRCKPHMPPIVDPRAVKSTELKRAER